MTDESEDVWPRLVAAEESGITDAYLAKLATKSKHHVTVFSTFTLNAGKNWNMSRPLTSLVATHGPSNIPLIPFNDEGNHSARIVANRTKEKIVLLDSKRRAPPKMHCQHKQGEQYRVRGRHIQDLQALIEACGRGVRWGD